MLAPDLSCSSVANEGAFDLYDRLMRRHAWKTATALALLVMMPAIGVVLQQAVPALGTGTNRVAVGLGTVGLVAAVLLYAWSNHALSAFAQRYPCIDNRYTAAQRQFDARTMGIGIGAGVALILAGAGLGGLCASSFDRTIGTGIFLLFVAAALWAFAYAVCLAGRSSFRYGAVPRSGSMYPRVNLVTEHRHRELVGSACFAIMALATLGALLLLAVQGVYAEYFWLSWLLGAALCGAAALATGSLTQPKGVEG